MLQSHFHDRIAQLVYTFPEDAVTSTGSLFWSPPKRCPHPLHFSAADAAHAAFVQAGAILKAAVHGIALPAWAGSPSKVCQRLYRLCISGNWKLLIGCKYATLATFTCVPLNRWRQSQLVCMSRNFSHRKGFKSRLILRLQRQLPVLRTMNRS